MRIAVPTEGFGRWLGRALVWCGAGASGGLVGLVTLGILLYGRDPSAGPFVLSLLRWLHRPDGGRLAVLLALVAGMSLALVARARRGRPPGRWTTPAAAVVGAAAGAGFLVGLTAARRPPGTGLEAALVRAGWDLALLVVPFAIAAAAAQHLWTLAQVLPPGAGPGAPGAPGGTGGSNGSAGGSGDRGR